MSSAEDFLTKLGANNDVALLRKLLDAAGESMAQDSPRPAVVAANALDLTDARTAAGVFAVAFYEACSALDKVREAVEP